VTPRLRIVPLDGTHDRSAFDCGVEPLNRYLREQAGQDVKRRICNCFLASLPDGKIAGYYTLAAASIPLTELPEATRRKLPRYGFIPAALVGRLAVATAHRRARLGGALVADAARRAARAGPAVHALIVDAKDDNAVGFYMHLGFRQFESRPMTLFLPLATALAAFGSA
jgi:ribosomal protein S18 acetylase RimI-like enzyme